MFLFQVKLEDDIESHEGDINKINDDIKTDREGLHKLKVMEDDLLHLVSSKGIKLEEY